MYMVTTSLMKFVEILEFCENFEILNLKKKRKKLF
jgi:hypothetical protein